MGKHKKANQTEPSRKERMSKEGHFSPDKGKRHYKKWSQKNKRHAPPFSASTSQKGSCLPASSSSSSEHDVLEIPGFYYDAEKKNYFKILPNSMSSVASFVTSESIQKKKNEDKRLADLKNIQTGKSAILKAALFSTSPNEYLHRTAKLMQVLSKLQCGQVTCENFRTHMNRHRCMTLLPGPEIINDRSHQPSLKFDDLQRMITTGCRDYLACVWSVKSSVAQCIQLLSVGRNLRTQQQPRGSPPAIIPVSTSQPIFKKLSSLCWASAFPGHTEANTVLCTATCPIGYSPTIAYVYNLDAPTRGSISLFELNLGFSTVWSSAWHNFRTQFSVGSERKCHLIDVATRRTWTYFTHDSDPLAQIFSSTDPHRMYNGTRGGLVIVHDVRCPGKSSSQQHMRQRHGVGCLRLRQSDNYIMASDFTGDIVNWDHRMGRVVKKYEGLVNSHYQLPFHLDESESVLCAAGSDSYSKVWDVVSGQLLQNIPPQVTASLESFPVAIYSQHWGNTAGNSAIIVGLRNVFQVYC